MVQAHAVHASRLTSELENVAGAVRQVLVFCKQHLPTGPRAGSICCAVELGITEVLTNVIRHAYAGQGGRPIDVEVRAGPGALEFHVFDEGVEMAESTFRSRMPGFDPQDKSTLPEGGFGWALIVSQMDQVRYRREGRRNHLALVKKLNLL